MKQIKSNKDQITSEPVENLIFEVADDKFTIMTSVCKTELPISIIKKVEKYKQTVILYLSETKNRMLPIILYSNAFKNMRIDDFVTIMNSNISKVENKAA